MPPTLPSESPISRRPPQSNCPPGNVRLPDYGQPLEPKSRKGGISLVTRPRLAPRLQSLPPMLHMRNPSPMPRCSKAPRGLFVQVCVTRVFTGISVSPGSAGGLRRYEPAVMERIASPLGKLWLTRQGISLESCLATTSQLGGHHVPACRHADGTISSSEHADVRRMASEDSDRVAVIGLSC